MRFVWPTLAIPCALVAVLAVAQMGGRSARANSSIGALPFTLKSVQLKGKSKDDVKKYMKERVSKALGVKCAHCHVEDDMAADTPMKKRAFDMFTMTAEINKKYMKGKELVSCMTCHQGKATPKKMKLGLLVISLLSFSACGGDPAERPASWGYLHAAIIAPACTTTSCHSSLAKTGEVVLDDPEAARRTLIDEGFVLPGDPQSPLLFQLDGNERSRMPPDAPLPEADIDLIRRWIIEGARP